MLGVPSPEKPKGSNAAAPSPTPPKNEGRLCPVGLPVGSRKDPEELPRLRVGLNDMPSRTESWSANDMSGADVGAADERAESELPFALASTCIGGWSEPLVVAGCDICAAAGSGGVALFLAEAAAPAVDVALSFASPARCVDRKLDEYGEGCARGLGPLDPGEAEDRIRPDGSLMRRSVTK